MRSPRTALSAQSGPIHAFGEEVEPRCRRLRVFCGGRATGANRCGVRPVRKASHLSAELWWCIRLGSNQQPLPSEGSTLSIELRMHAGAILLAQRFLPHFGLAAGLIPVRAPAKSAPPGAFRWGAENAATDCTVARYSLTSGIHALLDL